MGCESRQGSGGSGGKPLSRGLGFYILKGCCPLDGHLVSHWCLRPRERVSQASDDPFDSAQDRGGWPGIVTVTIRPEQRSPTYVPPFGFEILRDPLFLQVTR